MSLLHALVLAVVQGLTEFLPVSSTAHLVLFPWLLGWSDGGQAFDVALHLGTLVAVVIYFFGTWVELITSGFGVRFPSSVTDEQFSTNRRLFWLLVAATIPGAAAGFAFEKVIDEMLRQPVPIAIAMIVVGVLMYLADAKGRLSRRLEQVSLNDSLIVGISQAAALFPGVSRSGATISAGLMRGLTREAAARFSFLMATPIIAGAALKEIPGLIKMQQAGLFDISLLTLAAAVVVSGVVGYLVIAFFIRYLQTRTLKIFVVYRILFGIVVLLLVYLHRGVAR